MTDISTQYDDNGKMERRANERRSIQRRNASGTAGHFNGQEKRTAIKDRRITIINRLRREVTDRRSLN
jgi:hypothetical protein